MIVDDEQQEPDEQLTALLVALDESIRHDTAVSIDLAGLTPQLRETLRDSEDCLRLLDQIRRERLVNVEPDESSRDFDLDNLPRHIGRFEIQRELGRGGHGVVFLAIDPLLRRTVALKVPRPEALITPAMRSRFLREAQAAARLTHPNVAAIHEVGQVGPISYIAAAYCAGPTLAQWLERQSQPACPRLAASFVAILADAIQYAHSQGVLHRDLKPSNVLLVPKLGDPCDGSPNNSALDCFEPKLTDFGLAKLTETDGERTLTGTLLGTPSYMAPEQAAGRTGQWGPQTDVYGLGGDERGS